MDWLLLGVMMVLVLVGYLVGLDEGRQAHPQRKLDELFEDAEEAISERVLEK